MDLNQPIRLSAFGRELNVGDLYNYFNDDFVVSELQVPKDSIRTSILDRMFLFQHQSLKMKCYALGIDSHLNRSIEQGLIGFDNFWLADYLKMSPTDCDDTVAQVDVYFRVVRRTETVSQGFRQSSKWKEYQWTSEGQTHFVEKVVYGAEFLCSMRRSVDLTRETKESAQGSMYLAAKTYFDQAIGPNSIDVQPPAELDSVTCTMYNSLKSGDVVVGSFSSACAPLKDVINDDDPLQQWRPIEIFLRYIPEQLKTRLESEKTENVQLEKEKMEETWKRLADHSSLILAHPSADRARPLKKVVAQLRDRFARLRFAAENFLKSSEPTKREVAIVAISLLLEQITEWLIRRHRDLQMFTSLLRDNTQQLPDMFDLEEIKAWAPSNGLKKASVFVLKVDYIRKDELLEKVKLLTNHSGPVEKIPVFPVFSLGKKRLEFISKSLQAFAEEAQASQHSPSPDTGYYIGLVPLTSPFDDGTITAVEFSGKTLQIGSQLQGSFYRQQAQANETLLAAHPRFAVSDQKPLGPRTVDVRNLTESLGHLEIKRPLNQRVATFFAQEANGYSQLIRRGKPNVFLLNAQDNSADDEALWFDIGLPDGVQPSFEFLNHKFIILMGATGSGKSTLINGMVNYILGVQWKDPFRFKCVREEESTIRNQAHSQTSLVTAYTIHHHKGMAVPYSITIIDTPGYGDTRGVARDKEITQKIHRFLTQVDGVDAACFVATSGDSRLTPTQRFILDSMKGMSQYTQDKLRLLVTFADNADPPVVEACRAANFPILTSSSTNTPYSKFNSSVLYASNAQQGEEDFGFDELFWDMCQENFQKFFEMLE